jgi:hypothetical protein
MAHDHPSSPAHKHPIWLYLVIIVGVVALMAWGIIAYRGHHENKTATAKAEQLQQKLKAAGVEDYPNTDELVTVLGTDGGAVCEDTGKSLTEALLKQQLSNGAGGPGQRPVDVAKETLQGQAAIIEVYCPQKLDKWNDFLNGLKFDDVVKQ